MRERAAQDAGGGGARPPASRTRSASSRAASASGWRWRGRWCWTRRWCWPTSPRATSIRPPGDQVARLLLEMNRNHGTTLIVVTHSARMAEQLGRTLVLKEGRLAGGLARLPCVRRSPGGRACERGTSGRLMRARQTDHRALVGLRAILVPALVLGSLLVCGPAAAQGEAPAAVPAPRPRPRGSHREDAPTRDARRARRLRPRRRRPAAAAGASAAPAAGLRPPRLPASDAPANAGCRPRRSGASPCCRSGSTARDPWAT